MNANGTMSYSASSEQGGSKEIHVPVLLQEVLDLLVPETLVGTGRNLRFMDGTLGLGGHAKAVLTKVGKGAELLGLDRDAQALGLARERLAPFGEAVHFAQTDFAGFEESLDNLEWDYIDGALVDLGVSSLQLDSPERGFSFLREGPLDMRMDPNGEMESAASLVNRASVQQLKELIGVYGEEPQAGRIARAIDDARARKPIENTLELAEIVEKAYPAKWRATARNHPATRTFQALRMVVNEELEQLRNFLERIVPRLKPGGRVAVISFHSLEDRIVKHFFRSEARDCICPTQIMRCVCGHKASLRLVNKKALEASPEESKLNPRARSAKLRVAERTDNKFKGLATSFDSNAEMTTESGVGHGRLGRKSGRGNGKVKDRARRLRSVADSQTALAQKDALLPSPSVSPWREREVSLNRSDESANTCPSRWIHMLDWQWSKV